MKLVLVSILFSTLAFGNESPFFKEKITWSQVKKVERNMEKWAAKVGDKDLIAIGKMRQRPDEIPVIRYFYPYLLPEGFFGRNIDMSCYPDFKRFGEKKSLDNYNSWRNCIRSIYNENPPRLLQKAIKDLKPSN